MYSDGSAPQETARSRIEPKDLATLSGSDNDLARRTGNIHDHRVDEVSIEYVVWCRLVEPDQVSRMEIECDGGIGVQVRPRPARTVRGLRGARERRGVSGPPVDEVRRGIDRGRVPGTAS